MTLSLDLPERYRQQLLALLEAYVPEAEAWAYGSRVQGTHHDASDLDVVLRGPNLAELGAEFLELVEAVRESTIPILIDVFDWARLPESFHREIEREYVVLKEARTWREPETVDAFGRSGSIDLDPSHRRVVMRLLRGFVPSCEVRAYGPRAEWTAEQHSRLDIAVLGASNVNPYALTDLRAAFQRSCLPFSVNVADWDTMPDELREAIGRRYLVLQSSASPPDGWRTTTLGEFAPLTYGRSLPARLRVTDGSVAVYGSNGVVGTHDVALTDCPTVIVGRKGSVGAVHYSGQPCWPIDTTYFVKDTDSVSARFKYYVLGTLGLEQMNTDSAVPGLNREAAHAREFRVPAESDQRKISAVLSVLDDRIDLNRRMCETLEEMAQALFKSWLVDFEPVRAKMEGRWREGESLPGLPAYLYNIFPDRLVDSELGPIPSGWRVAPLDETASFTNGLALQKFPAQPDRWLPVIKIAEMRRGYTERTDRCSSEINERYIINDGDLLFSWSGSLEVVFWSHGTGALNQHLFKVEPMGVPLWLCWLWLTHHLPSFRETASDRATTMGHIRRHHLNEALVAVPPIGIVNVLNPMIGNLVEQLATGLVNARVLMRHRDTLLPKLISGEVRLPEVVEAVGC